MLCQVAVLFEGTGIKPLQRWGSEFISDFSDFLRLFSNPQTVVSTFKEDVVGNGLGQDDTFGVVGMGGFVIPKNTFIATTPGRDYGQGGLFTKLMNGQSRGTSRSRNFENRAVHKMYRNNRENSKESVVTLIREAKLVVSKNPSKFIHDLYFNKWKNCVGDFRYKFCSSSYNQQNLTSAECQNYFVDDIYSTNFSRYNKTAFLDMRMELLIVCKFYIVGIRDSFVKFEDFHVQQKFKKFFETQWFQVIFREPLIKRADT